MVALLVAKLARQNGGQPSRQVVAGSSPFSRPKDENMVSPLVAPLDYPQVKMRGWSRALKRAENKYLMCGA